MMTADPFDKTLEDTAEILDQVAEETLAEGSVQAALADTDRDETW